MTVTPLKDHATQLREARTSSDFAAVLSSMDTDLNDARNRRADLLQAEDRAIFGDGNLTDVRHELRKCDDLIDHLEKSIEGAARRKREAGAQEDQAILEEKAAETAKDAAKLAKDWTELAALVEEARLKHAEIDRTDAKLTRRNSYFESEGRRDLTVNLMKIKREAVGQRGPQPEGLSRTGRETDHLLSELLFPRGPGRRPMPGSFRPSPLNGMPVPAPNPLPDGAA